VSSCVQVPIEKWDTSIKVLVTLLHCEMPCPSLWPKMTVEYLPNKIISSSTDECQAMATNDNIIRQMWFVTPVSRYTFNELRCSKIIVGPWSGHTPASWSHSTSYNGPLSGVHWQYPFRNMELVWTHYCWLPFCHWDYSTSCSTLNKCPCGYHHCP